MTTERRGPAGSTAARTPAASTGARIPAIEAPASVDPVTLEVLRNGLYSVSDEMVAGLIRASYSTNIKDRRDCSCGVYTAEGDVIAMSEFGGTPLHLGTMHPAVRTVFTSWPAETLEPGDAIIMNTPYPAGPGHLNDVCVVGPIFVDGELFAISASQSHRVDIGGFAPGSMPFGVTEHYQEGLQITPMKIMRRGVLDVHLLAFINQNVRTPEEQTGDLMAQIAANVIAQRRIDELVTRHGRERLRTYFTALLDYSERRMIAGIRTLPEGVYRGQDVIEGDGIITDDIAIRVEVTVRDGRFIADFSDSDPQVLGPINCRWPSVAACVYYLLKCLVDPELPANAGAYRPVEVRTRPGTLLEAQFPAAVCNANIITTQRIVDALLRALVEAAPERAIAACSGTMNLLNVGGYVPETGRYFNYIETYGGGQGAMHDRDGMNGVHSHMTNTRNAPVEAIEAAYPLRVRSYGLVPDSEGAGRWRGGVGMHREFEILGSYTRLTVSS
ncbi:MAG TPA: hydantoinase B/oxoprolinase family protein, partial [Candidatus Saccharimonadales bacterium]|nr:hydantoinase B/oxoprolinase family protein [Candidatus Saccharimonadales bacterium]